MRYCCFFLLLAVPGIAQPQRYLIQPVAGPGILNEGALALKTHFRVTGGVAVAQDGTVFASDYLSHVIKAFQPGGAVRIVAGLGTAGFSPDGTLAREAYLDSPQELLFDASGVLYFIETGAGRIRKIDAAGRLVTVAGSDAPISASGGSGVLAVNVSLGLPRGLAFGRDGSLYFCESAAHVVRKISPDGRIQTVAGTGVAGHNTDFKPALEAQLNFPSGVALDSAGNLYIADRENNRIRRVTTDGILRTFSGDGSTRSFGDAGPASGASVFAPGFLHMGPNGDLFIVEWLT